MTNNESTLFADVLFNSTMMYVQNEEDELLPDELANIESEFTLS